MTLNSQQQCLGSVAQLAAQIDTTRRCGVSSLGTLVLVSGRFWKWFCVTAGTTCDDCCSEAKLKNPGCRPRRSTEYLEVELGPVYVKLGQLLSTRPDLLPPQYIEELTALQAEVPPVPWEAVEVVIRQQLRQPLEATFATIDSRPVAAGSIAQTHHATLADGRKSRSRSSGGN